MQRQTNAGPRQRWLAGLCLLAMLAACGRDPGGLAGATSEPATAMSHLARQLADGDLVGYARDAVPPETHAELAQAFADGDSLWPLTGLPLDEHLPGLLEELAAPTAESNLRRAFDAQLAGQAANVRQTAHSLGLFGVQYVTHQGDFSDDQRTHYRQLVQAISQWAGQAPLAEREPAHLAIAQLVAVVGDSGLDGRASLQAAGMEGSLAALAPVQARAMDVLAGYGLDVRAALDGLQAGLLREDGDKARIQVQYPLAGQTIAFEADMVRIQGRWYLAQNLADAAQILSAARQARAQRDQDNAEARELAEGEVAGRLQTTEQMATGP